MHASNRVSIQKRNVEGTTLGRLVVLPADSGKGYAACGCNSVEVVVPSFFEEEEKNLFVIFMGKTETTIT